jgi:hypothetical protein
MAIHAFRVMSGFQRIFAARDVLSVARPPFFWRTPMPQLRTFAFALPVLLASASAVADEPKAGKTKTTMADLSEGERPSPDKVTDDTGLEHLRGLEITLRPGYGSAGTKSPLLTKAGVPADTANSVGPLVNGASAPYGGGFAGQAFLGYRFHPIVSAGLRGGYRGASASNLSDGSTGLSRTSWDAGMYVRGYPLALSPSIRKFMDPWAGVGVEYMHDSQAFKNSLPVQGGGSIPFDRTIEHHAVAVPLGVGVDFRVLPMVSIGPSFEYTIANAIAGCVETSTNVPGLAGTTYCSNSEPGKSVLKADSYGVWTAGLDLRATLF